MPTIRKESFGALSDGRETLAYILRNTKGNELKVTDYGARIVSMRFRDKNFDNKFLLKTYPDASGYENDCEAGIVYVDGDAKKFAQIIWNTEIFTEGVRFTAEVDGTSAEIVYSLSNDNEISIKYKATGASDISTQLVFSADALPDPTAKIFDENSSSGKISGANSYAILDKPASVEMELGMFGYDIGCPIDYLDGGLKNAAEILSDAASILTLVYATQNNLHIAEHDGGYAVKTSGAKNSDGVVSGQTVYVFKNRR